MASHYLLDGVRGISFAVRKLEGFVWKAIVSFSRSIFRQHRMKSVNHLL